MGDRSGETPGEVNKPRLEKSTENCQIILIKTMKAVNYLTDPTS